MDIFGTIITIEQFLKNEKAEIRIQTQQGPDNARVLEVNREYIVPSFQRELRWKKQQVVELLRDISNGSIFLGNIILKQNGSKSYEIIDGQQRITTLVFFLDYIKSKYENQIVLFDLCKLKIENFPSYEIFANNHYSLQGLSDDEINKIKEQDYYNQAENYALLYDEISKSATLDNKVKVDSFLRNLKESLFNIIISDSSSKSKGMQYFMDVNLKGVKLDDEDIFVSYLYSIDSSKEMQTLWREFKKLNHEFNFKFNKKKYEVVDMLEHFLYCDLYRYDKYKDVQFNKKFLLKNNVTIDGAKYYEGDHVVKVIGDYTYFRNMLNRLNSILEIMVDIKKNPTGVADKLKKLLSEAGVNGKQHQIINSYLSTILLDQTLILPNSLIMKFILEVLDAEIDSKKEIFEGFYSLILYINLFTLLKPRKSLELIIPILKEQSSHNRLMLEIKNMINDPIALADGIKNIQFKLDDDANVGQKFKAKMLASIYNYFVIRDNTVEIRDNKYSELLDYINSDLNYSIEHFIVNDSNNCVICIEGEGFTYSYPEQISRYRDEIFNYIFVPYDFNGDVLKNNFITQKVKLVDKNQKLIKCEYTLMFIKELKRTFTKLNRLSLQANFKTELDTYFLVDFYQTEYPELKKNIVKNLIDRIISG